MRYAAIAVMPLVVCAVVLPTYGALQFYDSETEWKAALSRWETMPLDGSHLALVLGSAPDHQQSLGTSFSMLVSETGLASDLTLSSGDTGYELLFWKGHPYGGHPYGDMIAPGGSSHSDDDDDWEMVFGGGGQVRAFAVDVVDNNEQAETMHELFSVYGVGDAFLGSLRDDDPAVGWPVGTSTFLGVISDVPITRVYFDEGTTGGDNIGVGQVWISDVPEPATLSLLGLGGLGLLKRRGA